MIHVKCLIKSCIFLSFNIYIDCLIVVTTGRAQHSRSIFVVYVIML